MFEYLTNLENEYKKYTGSTVHQSANQLIDSLIENHINDISLLHNHKSLAETYYSFFIENGDDYSLLQLWQMLLTRNILYDNSLMNYCVNAKIDIENLPLTFVNDESIINKALRIINSNVTETVINNTNKEILKRLNLQIEDCSSKIYSVEQLYVLTNEEIDKKALKQAIIETLNKTIIYFIKHNIENRIKDACSISINKPYISLDEPVYNDEEGNEKTYLDTIEAKEEKDKSVLLLDQLFSNEETSQLITSNPSYLLLLVPGSIDDDFVKAKSNDPIRHLNVHAISKSYNNNKSAINSKIKHIIYSYCPNCNIKDEDFLDFSTDGKVTKGLNNLSSTIKYRQIKLF